MANEEIIRKKFSIFACSVFIFFISSLLFVSAALNVRTLGLSENSLEPTRGEFDYNRTIFDDIKIYDYAGQTVQDYYLGHNGIESDGCGDGRLHQAENTFCSYTSGDTIDCRIELADTFLYFDSLMKFYGCAKINGAWYVSPAEFLIIDSNVNCGDGRIEGIEDCELHPDCDDGNSITLVDACYECVCYHPCSLEICNDGIDNDCDGNTDIADMNCTYKDIDLDGFFGMYN